MMMPTPTPTHLKLESFRPPVQYQFRHSDAFHEIFTAFCDIAGVQKDPSTAPNAVSTRTALPRNCPFEIESTAVQTSRAAGQGASRGSSSSWEAAQLMVEWGRVGGALCHALGCSKRGAYLFTT